MFCRTNNSFLFQRGQIFRVHRIDARTPGKEVAKLENLKFRPVVGSYYLSELVKTEKPAKDHFFTISGVLKEKTTKDGKKILYVKYRDYPAEFNEWIPEENLLK